MDAIDAVLHSSPADAEQIIVGVAAGAILVAALAAISLLRRLALALMAIVIVAQVLLHGLNGLMAMANVLVDAARAHEPIVKGLLAGKILAGLWCHLQDGSHAQQRRDAAGRRR